MSALNLVFSGGIYIPPEILGSGTSDETEPLPQGRSAAASAAGHRRPTWD